MAASVLVTENLTKLTGKITDKLSLFGGLVLMDSKVTKSNVDSANKALFPTNVGLKLANIAHQSFNVLAKYEFNEMWEVGHVARFLKRSDSWVYKKSASGILPVHRLDDNDRQHRVRQHGPRKRRRHRRRRQHRDRGPLRRDREHGHQVQRTRQ